MLVTLIVIEVIEGVMTSQRANGAELDRQATGLVPSSVSGGRSSNDKPSHGAILALQATAGNQAVSSLFAHGRAASNPAMTEAPSPLEDRSPPHRPTNRVVLQRDLTQGESGEGVPAADLGRLHELTERYRELVSSGRLSREEVSDVRSAIARAEQAIRRSEQVRGRGSGATRAASVAVLAAGGLAADDVTVIGVGDDVAIPFVLLGAAALAAIGWSLSSSPLEMEQAQRAARDAVTEAIASIGQVVLAQRVGEQVRGLTGIILVHLARFLGEAVGGQPPDHQGDPERDRPHWWVEIKNWIREIHQKGLSPRQLLRELRKRFSDQQLGEMREALRRIAEMMGEDPPDFPPAFP